MSDAPQQPPLRLKPRIKTEGDSTTAAAAPTPESQAPAPKSAPPPTPPAATEAPIPVSPFKVRTPPPTADLSQATTAVPPAPSASEATPAQQEGTATRFKLRPKEQNTPAANTGRAATPPPLPASEAQTPPPAPTAPPPVTVGDAPQAPTADSAEQPAPAATLRAFKLMPKPPATAHAHPEGVPPAFVVDSPDAGAPAATPAIPPSGVNEGATPASEAKTEPAPKNKAGMPPSLPAHAKPSISLPPPPAKPKVPHFKSSEKLNLPQAPAPVPPAERKAFKVGLALTAILGLVVVLGGGAFVYFQFFNSPPPPPPPPAKPPVQAQAKPAEPPPAEAKPAAAPTATAQASGNDTSKPQPPPTADSPTPSHDPDHPITVRDPLSMPGKMVRKAEDAISARRNIEQERADAVLDGRDTPDNRGFPLSKSDGSQAKAAPAAYSNIAPGVAATDGDIVSKGKTSATFRRTVSEFVIRGVFQGNPARAHINGRIVVAGNLVDRELGIVFVGVDPDEKTLSFKDPTGAIITRHY